MRFATTAMTAIAAAVTAAAAAPDPDAEAAFDALRAGGLQEARARFESVMKRNPSDCASAVARASTLPAADALKAMDSLSRAQNAPGWAKARGLRFIGDHRFAKGDYKNAADFYGQASKLDSSSVYRHLYALSIAADGRLDAARAVWAAIAGDSADGMSGEASSLLRQTAPVNPQPVQQGPAQSAPVDDKPAAPANQQQTAPAAKQQENAVTYTVQVGAFGSKDNADNLVRRLVGTYSDVYVSPTVSGGQTLYRVRVGAFSRREDADALADKLITGAGLSARVFVFER